MPTLKRKRTQTTAASQRNGTKKGETESASAGRKIIYTDITSVIHSVKDTHGPITVEMAKDALGWEEEDEKHPFGNKHAVEVSRVYGKKVRLSNNVTNRPIYGTVIATLLQDILRGRWVFNGEPIIIGITGLILNGQHTLIALILAAKELAENPDNYPAWIGKDEPTIDKLIVYGVSEEDTTVNTMDTCKPRTLADVIYRASYFRKMKGKAQREIAKICSYAIKMLWKRTGIHSNAFAVKQTHSESIAFLEQHPRLLDCVKHVYEENSGSAEEGDNKIAKYLSPGYAAAAMFLMASSESDPQEYFGQEVPSEEHLNWDQWDRAQEFFVELAGGSAAFKAVRDNIAKLISAGAGSIEERWAVLAKAWGAWVRRKPITDKVVKLDFVVKDEVRHLTEEPLIGGVDIGEEGLHTIAHGDPTEEEVVERSTKVQEKKHGKPKVAKKALKNVWQTGDTAWVHAKGEDSYFATLKDEPYECLDEDIKVMVDAEDGEWEVSVSQLSLKQFEMVTE